MRPFAGLARIFGARSSAETHQEQETVQERALVYSPEFFLGSEVIPKKDIDDFLKGKAFDLGPDYYYGYIYRGGVLYYVLLASDEYVAGRLSVLSLAFLREGSYFYRPGSHSLVYLITNQNGQVSTEVAHAIAPGYEDLSQLELPDDDQLEPTLALRWSLRQRASYGYLAYGVIFLAALIAFASVSMRYRELPRLAQKELPVVDASRPVPRPNLALSLAKIGSEIDGKGLILKMMLAKGKLEYRVSFPEENAARSFAALHGGRYEEGNVVVFSPGSTDTR